MGAARSAVERATIFGHAALQAVVLDDWKALTDAHSTPLQRLEAAADLASWAIPEGKIAEIAGHALAKVAEQAAAQLAAAGVEHTAEHLTAAAASGKLWAARSGNAKIAEQHAMNPSKIWDRPLTEHERQGRFENHHDLTALLGPATERGGVKRNWHHIVENKSGFGSELVHNVKNVVAIQADPMHRDISRAFQEHDYRLGTGPDGTQQSLRTFLKDKPWDRHVAEGERQLRNRGLDPDKLRVETLQRFEQRVQLHDRLLGLSPDRPLEVSKQQSAPMLAVPGMLTATAGHATSSPDTERSTNAFVRDVPRPQAQTPGTSPLTHHASPLSVVRDGHTSAVLPGYTQHGRILSADGDRIVQDVGRGHTATYSRKELQAYFSDSKAFDAMLQSGNDVCVRVGRDGVVEMQQQVPGHGSESIGHQLLSHAQQSLSAAHNR